MPKNPCACIAPHAPLTLAKAKNPGKVIAPMKKLLLALLILAAIAGGFVWWIRGPIQQTTTAALKAYPVYSIVRLRNDMLIRARHQGVDGRNLLIHRPNLSGPRDRSVTTPNNDTLYSFAFLAQGGPQLLSIPDLPGRYHSAAIIDARTDNVVIAGTRDGGTSQALLLCGPTDRRGTCAREGRIDPRTRVIHLPSDESWLLIRVLVDGEADLPAARAAQEGFSLSSAAEVPFPDLPLPPVDPVALPTLPDPGMLLRRANPLIARNAYLQDTALAATGYGGDAEAFEALPVWRQWLWRALLPRIFARMRTGIAEGSRQTGDGWSKSPPGIGTAEASPAIRAAVALGGLGVLPVSEAVYWSATLDSSGQTLDGAKSYRLTLPATIPARAFWSLSLYERLPDGRLFYVENPLNRYAIGNRTSGLARAADGSLTLEISAAPPSDQTNWLPAPKTPFTLIFRAYLPEQPILNGSFRLPPVQQIP